jgi:hypothetical protein
MLEQIVANISGKMRREIFNGREHLVAPLSLIVPGVLNGSNGPLFYPHDELAKEPSAWNHIPIVLQHPMSDGKPISARSADVLSKSQLGIVLHAVMNGKLTAEGWFDVDYMRQRAPGIFKMLTQGKPVELSTGLLTDTVPEQGEHNGVKYEAIARNYRPDHLAILTDQVGACSIKDGCGVLVNKSNKKESTMKKLTDAQREKIADFMIANCECWEETDREVLNAMSDEKLTVLQKHVESTIKAEAVANAARKGFEHGDVGFTFNEKDLKFEGKDKPKPAPKVEEPVVNKDEPKKPVTADEWMAAAPPEIQSVVRNAMGVEKQQKADLAKVILANRANTFKEEQLAAKSVDELQSIAALARTEEAKPSYFGSSVPTGNQQKPTVDEDDFLPLPTINYAELAKQQRTA